jgi:hypothetical protein
MSIPITARNHNLDRGRLFNKEEGKNMEEQSKGNEHNNRSHDRFSSLMFGPRKNVERMVKKEGTKPNESSIDFSGLIENYDKLMDSVQNLKPLFNKAYPIVEKLWKKK